jgi:hypothetical protein
MEIFRHSTFVELLSRKFLYSMATLPKRFSGEGIKKHG